MRKPAKRTILIKPSLSDDYKRRKMITISTYPDSMCIGLFREDSVSKDTWECRHCHFYSIKEVKSIIKSLQMGVDWMESK